MELLDAQALATTLINKHSLIGWSFKFNRSRRTFGLCRYRLKQIDLSAPLVLMNDEERVRDVVLHEIAHALVGVGHNHDNVWSTTYKEIGGTYQYRWSEEDTTRAEMKFLIMCKVHGVKGQISRRTKKKKSCGKCSRHFDERYLLSYQLNPKYETQRRETALASRYVSFHSNKRW